MLRDVIISNLSNHIDCDHTVTGKECNLNIRIMGTTCASYKDKHGNNINPDRNVKYGHAKCLTCGLRFNFRYYYYSDDKMVMETDK